MLIADINRGYIINGSDENNQWITSIQSILEVPSQQYYLSQECRMENVHFLNENGPGIFTDRETGSFRSQNEWLTATIGDKFFCFSTFEIGSEVTEWQRQHAYFINSYSMCPIIFSKPTWESKVYCKNSNFRELSVRETLDKAFTFELKINNIVAIISYDDDKRIIMPINYLNYASRYKKNKYIQPIQGKVLIEISGSIMAGYISYASNNKGEDYCEFTPEVVLLDESFKVLRTCYRTSVELKQVTCKLYIRQKNDN